jgi:hypothetical protein
LRARASRRCRCTRGAARADCHSVDAAPACAWYGARRGQASRGLIDAGARKVARLLLFCRRRRRRRCAMIMQYLFYTFYGVTGPYGNNLLCNH